MVNQAILGGLKSALARGESLKKAMMTLYNAGYRREEISEAAQIVHQEQIGPETQISNKPAITKKTIPQKKPQSAKKQKSSLQKTKEKKFSLHPVKSPKDISQSKTLRPVSKSSAIPQQQFPRKIQQVSGQQSAQPIPVVIQNVSGYGQSKKPKSSAGIIILGFFLLFLVGILVTIFLFKEDLLEFFSNSLS